MRRTMIAAIAGLAVLTAACSKTKDNASELSPIVSDTPTATATEAPVASPTSTPTPAKASATPTPTPTLTTAKPTPIPTPTPTPTKTTAKPTPTPTKSKTPTPTATPAGGTLTISGFKYSSLTVVHGARVTLVNQDGAEHTATLGGVSHDAPGSSTTTFTAPAAAGSYSITCDFHPSMHGTLTVT